MYFLPCCASAICKKLCAVGDGPGAVGAVGAVAVEPGMPYTGSVLDVPPNSDVSSESNDDAPEPPEPESPVSAERGLPALDPSPAPEPFPAPAAIAFVSSDANSGDGGALAPALVPAFDAPAVVAMIWL